MALGFLLLPVLGVIAIKVTHGLLLRSLFPGGDSGIRDAVWRRRWCAAARLCRSQASSPSCSSFCVSDALIAAYCHWHHADLDQVGPEQPVSFGPDPAEALLRNCSSAAGHVEARHPGHRTIPTISFFEYYAPPELRRRLIFAAPDSNEMDFSRLSASRAMDRHRISDSHLTTNTSPPIAIFSSTDQQRRLSRLHIAGRFSKAATPCAPSTLDTDSRLEHFSR